MEKSDRIHITAHLRIKDGRMPGFKDVARQLVEAVETREPGALQYLWFLDSSGMDCRVREIYLSSEAVLAHFENVGDLMPRLLETADQSLEVCGPVSPALRELLAGLPSIVYSSMVGVDRL